MNGGCDVVGVCRITDRTEWAVGIAEQNVAHGGEVAANYGHACANGFEELVRRGDAVIQRARQVLPAIEQTDPSELLDRRKFLYDVWLYWEKNLAPH